ncbi:Hypothetical protein POVR2_LOCUS98 [uncultured virus]|nr:Hypothetical protein POVR2_LOCUS98 [uncultured virus]
MRPSLLTVEATYLPIELLNEPIATVDNGYRVELIVPRQEFDFEVTYSTVYYEDCSIDCSIGEDRMPYPESPSIEELESNYNTKSTKLACQHSVLNIYDTYGLEITKLFLDNLRARRHLPRIVRTSYLYYSLVAMDSTNDYSAWQLDIKELSVLVLNKLNELEDNKPRASESITLVPELPIELLVRIINSKRISKVLSVQVEQFRKTEPLSHRELEQASWEGHTYSRTIE